MMNANINERCEEKKRQIKETVNRKNEITKENNAIIAACKNEDSCFRKLRFANDMQKRDQARDMKITEKLKDEIKNLTTMRQHEMECGNAKLENIIENYASEKRIEREHILFVLREFRNIPNNYNNEVFSTKIKTVCDEKEGIKAEIEEKRKVFNDYKAWQMEMCARVRRAQVIEWNYKHKIMNLEYRLQVQQS